MMPPPGLEATRTSGLHQLERGSQPKRCYEGQCQEWATTCLRSPCGLLNLSREQGMAQSLLAGRGRDCTHPSLRRLTVASLTPRLAGQVTAGVNGYNLKCLGMGGEVGPPHAGRDFR